MGTRHHQKVITKAGELKISQYGQWDGYPDGQGIDILDYLRNADLDKYQLELSKINEITPEQLEIVNQSKNWKEEYPYLSRDCGAEIHQMVEKGNVKFVQFIEDDEANAWCNGFFTIDFEKNTFVTEGFTDEPVSFQIDNLPSNEKYLKCFEQED